MKWGELGKVTPYTDNRTNAYISPFDIFAVYLDPTDSKIRLCPDQYSLIRRQSNQVFQKTKKITNKAEIDIG